MNSAPSKLVFMLVLAAMSCLSSVALAQGEAAGQAQAPAPAGESVKTAPVPPGTPAAAPAPQPDAARPTSSPEGVAPPKSEGETVEGEGEESGAAVWGPVGEAALFTGVAVLATGVVFTILSLRVDTEAKSETDEAKRQDAVETRDLYKNVYLGCYIGGGVLTLTGAMLWGFIFEEEKEKSEKTSLRPVLSPTMVGVGGTF
ncbi:MAG: hypothetical protein HY897_20200 [Deltaproteobacteria bacterium]|nr:hypothetical protein [Deltaproteobacteria bacterium]